jgi:hypothetical protein
MPTTEATIIREALLSDSVQITSLISELGYSATEQVARDRLAYMIPQATCDFFSEQAPREISARRISSLSIRIRVSHDRRSLICVLPA